MEVTRSLLLWAMLVSMAIQCCYAANYNIAWSQFGNYADWETKKVVVGDTLTFQYNKGAHDVYQLSQAAYGNCDFSAPIAKHTAGGDVITLDTAQAWYFACSILNHCDTGMKLAVNVAAATDTTATPPPSASTNTTTPPPSNTTTSTTPPSGNSAPTSPSFAFLSFTAFIMSFLF